MLSTYVKIKNGWKKGEIGIIDPHYMMDDHKLWVDFRDGSGYDYDRKDLEEITERQWYLFYRERGRKNEGS